MANRPSEPSRRPTREDVARRANISGSTVSRVLNGRQDFQISDEVRERVFQAAREIGYRPNAAAKALRSGRAGLVGFWMCLGYSRYRSQVADEMQRVISGAGMAMAVSDADNEAIFEHSLDRVLRLSVDGIIAFDSFVAAGMYAQAHPGPLPPVPFVSMGAYWSEAFSYVGVDLRAGAQEATEHLLATGRRRVAFLAPWNSGLLAEGARYEGYRDAVVAAGFEPDTIAVEATRSEAIEVALRERATNRSLPDAVLCINDDLAMDAIPALERLGLRAGRDVALIGFNGTEGIEKGACPLSTVAQPIEAMCALAFESLKAQIEDPVAPFRQTVLRPHLVVRESSGR